MSQPRANWGANPGFPGVSTRCVQHLTGCEPNILARAGTYCDSARAQVFSRAFPAPVRRREASPPTAAVFARGDGTGAALNGAGSVPIAPSTWDRLPITGALTIAGTNGSGDVYVMPYKG